MQDYTAAAIDTALQIHLNQPEGEAGRQAWSQQPAKHTKPSTAVRHPAAHVSTQCLPI
jgi:hypothetical protein